MQWQRQAERLDVLSETAIAFVNVLGAQRRIQIYDGLIGSLDGIGPLLQRRVEAGASSQAEVARAQVAADLIRADRERAKTMLSSSRRELAALMGIAIPDFGAVTGDFATVARIPAFQSLLRRTRRASATREMDRGTRSAEIRRAVSAVEAAS